MFWDSTYILALIGAAVCAIASLNVNRTYKKYSGVLSGRGLTAEAVAEMILRRAGIYDVRIERVSGSLTDYYSPGEKVLKLRSAAVPVANIGSKIYWPVILLGLILGYMQLAQIGVLLFSFIVLFQLITLPVEFDASGRALRVLADDGILAGDELDGAKRVLRAAALTYVAALFSSVLQLLRLMMLTRGGDSRRK